jgi:hypothetical protein
MYDDWNEDGFGWFPIALIVAGALMGWVYFVAV